MSFGTAFTLAVERIVQPVEGMHDAIAGRVFSAVGTVGKPVQTVHDTISHTVYGAIRLAGAVAGIGLDRVLPEQSALTDRTTAIANGLWGDRLGRHQERLATPMELRNSAGTALPVGVPSEAQLPNATGHLVFLVHGFADTERCWRNLDDQNGLADRLEKDPTITPLLVRYNTGQRVAVNGAQLAALIEDVHASWPEPVRSVALVGHSMGGLVARSACAQAQEKGHEWIADVTQLVTLGAPYLGAPLEKLTNAASWGLNISQKTRPLADFLNTRSRGIKDLRSGTATADLPPGIQQHLVAGVVSTNPSHPAGYLLGDLIVRANSATGRGQIDAANSVVFGGMRHNSLPGDVRVVDRVMEMLTRPVDPPRRR